MRMMCLLCVHVLNNNCKGTALSVEGNLVYSNIISVTETGPSCLKRHQPNKVFGQGFISLHIWYS